MTVFFERLQKVAKDPSIFEQYGRGVERESLRYTLDGHLALTPHPKGLGSSLTNRWVTTDFSESLLEFITPVSYSVTEVMKQLSDIHHFTQKKLYNEKFWPLSMPCFIQNEHDIALAQYGNSNTGKMKTLYREGLKRRYGSLMQVISGVHFNFSFPESFWNALYGAQDTKTREETKSDAYFSLIRNYYRFGWMIPFFYGASPALCSSFVQGRDSKLPFEKLGETLYLPKATSLRLSDLGYTNSAQSELQIGFNSLNQYLEGLNEAIHSPSEEFAGLGVKVNGEYRQLNANVLQIENELYAPIRPKRVTLSNEKPSQALHRSGVEYIEVRSLDVNPFSPVGVNEKQIRFLDLFLTWCVLSESEEMDNCELKCWRDNWNKVILEGRTIGLELKIGCHGERLSLQDWAHRVFKELRQIAELMDKQHGSLDYQQVCDELETWIDQPELTISGQLLTKTKEHGGIVGIGMHLGQAYQQAHLNHQYQLYSDEIMEQEVSDSRDAQANIEADETQTFDEFLSDYFSYLKQQ